MLRRIALPLAVLAVTLLALFLRVWQLNQVPPGLWWDEATQGLDAAELLHGVFRIFYTSALGKEPLYIYLTAPFAAAWFGAPFAVRLAGALLSVLMVPALFACGRALFFEHPRAGAWAGLAAAILWTTNFWAQSISRIGFQVNAFPLVLTVAVLAWLNYARRPDARRSLTFGALAGLTLYTYLAARFTPALWVALFLLLPRDRRRAMRPTVGRAILAFALVALPIAVYFALHPQDFFGRINTFGVTQGAAAVVKPETLSWAASYTLKAFLGILGDPIARHNLPDQPSFTPVAAGLFALGAVVGLAAVALRRHQGALTALLWWALLCIPAILSRSSTPHYPRLFGALPAAMLIAALPFGFAAQGLLRVRRRAVAPVMGLLLAALLVFETTHLARAYFVDWAQKTDLYTFFQQDLWTVGEQVRARPGAVGVVALNEGYGKQLDYAFAGTPIFQLPHDEPDVAKWLQARLGSRGGQEVVSVRWGEGANQDADPKQLLQHYLRREGEPVGVEPFRGFQLETFRLGERPQFDAAGQAAEVGAAFDGGVTLQSARWGAAYPNEDRSGASAAAGTAFWVALEWQLTSPQPDLRAAVDLFDAAGHRLGSAEAPLMDLRERARPWADALTARTYHLVPIPATQPPGPVALAARLYNGQNGAPVLLAQPLPAPNSPSGASKLLAFFAQPAVTQAAQSPSPAPARVFGYSLAPGVTLLGADDWPATTRPGEKLTLRLYWQVGTDQETPPLVVTAERDGAYAAQSEIALPTGMSAPAIFHTDVDLQIDPDAEGTYTLTVGPRDGEARAIGSVEVAGRRRIREAPALTQPVTATFGSALRLLGTTAPASIGIKPGETITVTLVWQAEARPGADLARFLHALGPDGRPVIQRDGAPCAGRDDAGPEEACPATSWQSGEILVDTITLAAPPDLAAGRYPLATGWYDPATLQRLPAVDATGRPAPDNLLRLPVELVVEAGG